MDPLKHRTSFVPASAAHNQHDFRMGSEKKYPKDDEQNQSFEQPVLWEQGDRREGDKYSSDIPESVVCSFPFGKEL
jgi:hypothetical protein